MSLNGQNGSRLRSNGGKVILLLRAMEQSNKKEPLRGATMKSKIVLLTSSGQAVARVTTAAWPLTAFLRNSFGNLT